MIHAKLYDPFDLHCGGAEVAEREGASQSDPPAGSFQIALARSQRVTNGGQAVRPEDPAGRVF